MDKSRNNLEQDNMHLRQSLINEKLKKADEVFMHRLIYTGIIGVVLFILLCSALDGVSTGMQWVCIIIFIAVALVIFAGIQNHYTREKEDAYK